MQSKIKRLELLMKSKSYTSTKHTKYIRAENIAFKGMRNPTNKYLKEYHRRSSRDFIEQRKLQLNRSIGHSFETREKE